MTTDNRTIHGVQTGLTIQAETIAGGIAAGGRVLRQGETITLTAAQVDETRDRLGNTYLDFTPEEQVGRWGKVLFADGPAPEGLKFGGDDEGYLYQQGLRAREHARQISDPNDRKAALAEVTAEYGHVLAPQAQVSQYIPAGNI